MCPFKPEVPREDSPEFEVKPWAEQYVQENPEHVGSVFHVQKIKLRPKGVILEFSDFCLFFFKSTQTYQKVSNYLLGNAWMSAKRPGSKTPVDCPAIELTSSRPYGFYGIDDSVQCSIKLTEVTQNMDVYEVTQVSPKPSTKTTDPKSPDTKGGAK